MSPLPSYMGGMFHVEHDTCHMVMVACVTPPTLK